LVPDLCAESAWQIATGGPWPEPSQYVGDERVMAQAVKGSLEGIGLSSPNPSVCCILIKDGRAIGTGVHKRAGGPHAEVLAIRDAQQNGESTDGATACLTLEPCCHFGRTPPCTDALLQAGIKRAVVGARDQNPRVAGGGLAVLRANGVEVAEGVLGDACIRLHAPFFKLVKTGLPWVMLKMALGSDGAVGPKGKRVNVTPKGIQELAHALRRASDGIMVGRNTIAVDDPILADRWPARTEPHRVFHRIVLDSRAQLSDAYKIWQRVDGHSAMRALTVGADPINGVEDLRLPPGPGGCSLRHLLIELGLRGLNRLLAEGGPTLARQLLNENLVDVLHIFRSTKPAGGNAVMLDTTRFGKPAMQAGFDGGVWEVWERVQVAA